MGEVIKASKWLVSPVEYGNCKETKPRSMNEEKEGRR